MEELYEIKEGAGTITVMQKDVLKFSFLWILDKDGIPKVGTNILSMFLDGRPTLSWREGKEQRRYEDKFRGVAQNYLNERHAKKKVVTKTGQPEEEKKGTEELPYYWKKPPFDVPNNNS